MVRLGSQLSFGRLGSQLYDDAFGSKAKNKTPYADMLAEITQQQQDYYNSSYRPVAQGLIKDTQSTAIVDAAEKAVSVDNTAAINARRNRQKARLGVGETGVNTELGNYDATLNRSLQTDGSINDARIQQDERNTSLTNDLVGVSRGIATDALDGMKTASANESSRNAVNANAKAQNTAQRNQLLGSAASMALMFAFLM